MKIEHSKNVFQISGDLFEVFERGEVSAIAHVTNCMRVMGSGVALGVRQKYPAAFTAYKETIKKWALLGCSPLGDISFAKIHDRKYVFNLNAQMRYGFTGDRFLDYEAMYKTLEKTRETMNDLELTTLGVPYKMGSDRAGGDWNVVLAMLKSVFDDSPIAVTIVKL
jgi:O-acetyl-ADP-ribose deacetylase (regulator of RNase III)